MASGDILIALGASELVRGAGGFAIVRVNEDCCFVLTVCERKVDAYQQ